MTSFYQRLIDETHAARDAFFATPMLLDAAQNGVERGLYVNYLTQAYHHVRHTCPLLATAMGRCHHADQTLRDALIDYIDEEKGHEKWILDDIAFIGGEAAVAKATAYEGDAAVRIMVGYMYYAINHISPYAMLGMVHVLEGTSVDIASVAADAIAKRLELRPTKGFRYLTSHGAVDTEHVKFFENLVNTISDRHQQNIIIDTAQIVYRLWGQMYSDLVSDWEAAESPVRA